MGKAATPRRLHETEASAYARALKTSPRKLNLVAQAIRGKAASAALNELAFNRRRIARDIRKVLQAAIANAENNHQLDVDRLYVKEATVGRAFSLGRFHVRGRGRISPVEKYFSNLLIVVRERAPEEQAKDADGGEAGTKTAGAGKKSKAKAGGKEKA
jgi:large subunit ribosomal protein L22